ncbi:hypothetical protein [Novipirellula caenicola]|uniref:Uncharacterized protein n=1 Tax=Novipirellula caenicola TaxID=1536901 RepID=A0ABP9W1J6_9BACT
MIQLIIVIASAILLFALGCSWVEIAIALSIAFAFTYGSIAMHGYIERRSRRKVAPRSEKYSAAFFGIGLGIAMVANHSLQDEHFLLLTTIVFGGFIVAEMIAHALFGDPIPTEDPGVLHDKTFKSPRD